MMAFQPEPPTEKVIREWISLLSSADVRRREEATNKLRGAGDAARPHLIKAMESADSEVRERCRALMALHEMEPGARKLVALGVDVPVMNCRPELKKEYEGVAAAGKVEELLKKDYQWVIYAIDGLLSEDRKVVEGSLRLMHAMIRKRRIPGVMSELVKTGELQSFRAAQTRADEYTYWAQWWYTMSARNQAAEWENGPMADTENWDEALSLLGGGWKDGEPKLRFEKIKAYEKAAYPHLLGFIHDQDLEQANTAVKVLRALTGRDGKDPVTKENVVAVRAEWKGWLDSRK